jgi:hypothetical protein
VAVPAESAAGGAVLWATAPDLARTVERFAALVDGLRSAARGSDLASALPPPAAVRGTVEQTLRSGLLGGLLGVPDPAAVDLGQPVRMRLSLPASGPPLVVVSLGTTRPLEAVHAGKIVGTPAPDGRYLVGVGVEPDASAPWPGEEPGQADRDLVVAVAFRAAAPAIVGALQDLRAAALRAGGREAIPPWFADAVQYSVRFLVDVMDIDRLSFDLRLGDGVDQPPLRVGARIAHPAGSALAALVPALVERAPEFGLLESIDAGADIWGAARVAPQALERLTPVVLAAAERFASEVLAEGWREPVLEAFRAGAALNGRADGRTAFGARTTPDGRMIYTAVWGVTDAAGTRTAARQTWISVAALLQRVSDQFALGATVSWQERAAMAGDVEVDRLSLVVPRAVLGAVAGFFQPGEGDLRWDISCAVGTDRAVVTTDEDAGVIERALGGEGRGGGLAAGSPAAGRLLSPDPGLVEAGSIDLASIWRHNPAFDCPAAASLPPLPLSFTMTAAASGLEARMEVAPGGLADVVAVAKTLMACSAAPPAAAPAVP